MPKKTEPDYAGADNRRRFPVPEGKKRKNWTEDERKEFIEEAERLRPLVAHLTTKAPETKNPRKGLAVVEYE